MHNRMLWLPVLAAVLGSCTLRWEPAFRERADPSQFATVAIADASAALTFARIDHGGVSRVLAVTRYQGGTVEGIDLSAALGGAVTDPIRVFRDLGYEGLHAIVTHAPASAHVSVSARDLTIPVDLRDHHIAAGTNFPEHAGDAGTEQPFLFPKLVAPTAPRDPVPAGNALLDYEVEVAFVPLEAMARNESPRHMGLILCNDYTDRETLLRHVDPANIESGVGFTTGKSFPGYLPVGDLFVVPRDVRSFAAELELRLYVNNGLRQRSIAKEMIWPIDEIIAQTWARGAVRWNHRGRSVSLLEDSDGILARTLILSGTPHGTVFAGIGTAQKLAGLVTWLAGGWGEALPARVIAAYLRDARSAGVYLQPGDRVVIHVERMGTIQNDVRASPPAG